jgi:uncharacterized protein YegP (UPF0339 family)
MPFARFGQVARWSLVVGILAVAGFTADQALGKPEPGPQAKAKGKARRKAEAAARSLAFEIYQDKVQEYRWRLKATNGQIIATSGQGYKDKRDCESAIDRIKSDAKTKLKFETYTDSSQDTRWRLKATNGQIIATSGQGYKDKRDCDHAIDVIKDGASDAKIAEEK